MPASYCTPLVPVLDVLYLRPSLCAIFNKSRQGVRNGNSFKSWKSVLDQWLTDRRLSSKSRNRESCKGEVKTFHRVLTEWRLALNIVDKSV